MDTQIQFWLNLTQTCISEGNSSKAGQCSKMLTSYVLDNYGFRNCEELVRTTLEGTPSYSPVKLGRGISC